MVGRIWGLTRQSVFIGFSRRGYKMRSKKYLPFQVFNGVKFSLKPSGYYHDSKGKRETMHKHVWEFYNGKIPKGHDIHHIDHNRANNKIENLSLHTKSEHAHLFNSGRNQYSKKI